MLCGVILSIELSILNFDCWQPLDMAYLSDAMKSSWVFILNAHCLTRGLVPGCLREIMAYLFY